MTGPAFALKLSIINTSVQFENLRLKPDGNFEGDGNFGVNNNLIWDKNAFSEHKYPASLRFKWFVTAANHFDYPVILGKVSFKLYEDDIGPFDQLVQDYPLADQKTPPIKIQPGVQVTNLDQSDSTIQYVSSNAINDKTAFGGTLEFILKDVHVTATQHVPGPLPILGAAAAFSYSRKLRRSLKLKVDDAGSKKL